MSDIFVRVFDELPTFIGLVLLAYILYKQNTRLLDRTFTKIDALEQKVDRLEKTVSEMVTKLL